MGSFKSSIARIGGLLLVVDAWDNPAALRRAWCDHVVLYGRARSHVLFIHHHHFRHHVLYALKTSS
jgi:hypothetical protein